MTSVVKCRLSADEKTVKRLAFELKCDTDIARLLVARKITTKPLAEAFLNPTEARMLSPFEIDGINEAAAKINRYIKSGKKIVVYGDYDCDGICAVAIMVKALRGMNADADYFIPSRTDDGYGLSVSALDKVIESFNPHLILTVDCGITSAEEVEYLKNKGVDVIITDHHEPQKGSLPNAITVNPKVRRLGYFDYCGAGLALKLAQALTSDASQYFGYAALATLADVVPLTGENRIIVARGLKQINESGGMLSELAKTMLKRKNFNAGDIMFGIAPRINAAGRMGDADAAISLLLTQSKVEANEYARALEQANNERKELCASLTERVRERLVGFDFEHNPMIVLADTSWDKGILGIVSAKISDMFCRPALLLSDDGDGLLKGSARSVDGINIFDCLNANAHLCEKFGGHAAAAGVTLRTQNLQKLSDGLNEYIRRNYSNALLNKTVVYDLKFDQSKHADIEFIKQLDAFEPCGEGNPQPLFLMDKAHLDFAPIKPDSPHLKAAFGNLDILAFNQSNNLNDYKGGAKVAVSLSINEFRGVRRAQARVENQIFFAQSNISSEECAVYKLWYLLFQNDAQNYKLNSISIEKLPFNCDFSVLYIAFSEKTYYNFIKYADKKGQKVEASVASTGEYYLNNRIVLCPRNYEGARYFNKVVFLDRPPKGICRAAGLNPDAKMYFADDAAGFLQRFQSATGRQPSIAEAAADIINGQTAVSAVYSFPSIPSDQTIREIYVKSRDLICAENMSFLDLVGRLKIDYGLFNSAFAVAVFLELKFIIIQNGVLKIHNTSKTILEKSLIYNTLRNNSLRD